jgi:transcription elongation factor Elf1/predicted SAM-dependent methyltransferase|tara:strand:+ start:917 stop:1903 length:987 start_codon:yes stop_codon:yes gene_type:complete
MNEKKINPDRAIKVGAKKIHDNRKFMYDEVEKTHQKYLDKNGFYKLNLLEKRVKCPLCSSIKIFHIFNKRGGKYSICKNCDLVFLNPVFKNKELIKYYKNLHDAQSKVTLKEKKFYSKIYLSGIQIVNQYIKKKNFAFDIGCSNGLFLDLLKKNGWQNTHGQELNIKEAAIAKKNHKIFTAEINNIDQKSAYNLVTLWDVIEHIKNGKSFLGVVNRLLKKKGYLFIQTPNAQSLAAKIMHEKCNVFDGLAHVNLYDFKNLDLLCKQSGFKKIYSRTILSEIPIINNFLNFQNPYFGNVAGKTILNFLNEEDIHKNYLGYKTQALYQKI